MRPMGLQGRRVLLCVGGGIAAYKACELARLLVKDGAQVRVALTPAAQQFVTALTFQALTGSAVAADIFSAEQELAAGHISLADWAELAVVAPATANLLARLRIGQADDAAAAALLAIDPRRWLLAPAMNEKMWASPAVEENVRVLRERGSRRRPRRGDGGRRRRSASFEARAAEGEEEAGRRDRHPGPDARHPGHPRRAGATAAPGRLRRRDGERRRERARQAPAQEP